MPSATPTPAIVRFGVFEADLHNRELRKQGLRLKLQDQPFNVLAILLQRPGQVVTREELRSAIWAADTFVDFDNGLNTSINKLREALGDSANHPRFIQTVPRRGYRFVAPLAKDDPESSGGADTPPRWRRSKILAFSAIVLAASVAGGLVWRVSKTLRLTDRDVIVVADFANTTGDPAFDGALKQGLLAQLEQSPFLSVLSEQQVDEALRLMLRQPGERLTPGVARELCERIGGKAVLTGSISTIGARFVIGLNAANCQTGSELATQQSEAVDKEHVLAALGVSAAKIRKKLGESLPSIQKFSVPIEQVTTSSLEALQAYTLGLKHLAAYEHNDAILQFQRAAELDPSFASAYMKLAHEYEWLGQWSREDENAEKAYALRDRVSQRERYDISTRYAAYRFGDFEKVDSLAELWAATYPRDSEPRRWLADDAMRQGKWEEAAQQAQLALDLDPNFSMNYYNLAVSELALDRPDAALKTCDRAAARGMTDSSISMVRYWIAFVRHDSKELTSLPAALGDLSRQSPAASDRLWAQMGTALYFGKLAQAREIFQSVLESNLRSGSPGNAASLSAFWAFLNAELGNQAEARTYAQRAFLQQQDPGDGARVAFAFARAGDLPDAEKSAGKFAGKFHAWYALRYALPVARAAIALGRGNAAEAIEQLRVITDDRQWWAAADPSSLDGMLASYLRGQAYLQLRLGKKAAAEFQRLVDHPGIVVNSPLGPLARVGLGRAYVLSGDTAKARAAYQDFFTIWNDADPEIPILQGAKAEYARLERGSL